MLPPTGILETDFNVAHVKKAHSIILGWNRDDGAGKGKGTGMAKGKGAGAPAARRLFSAKGKGGGTAAPGAEL